MDRTDRIRQRQVFREASPYEQAQLEALRQRALAEALAQQAYVPMEGAAAPIPSAAPLVQALQGFMTARAGRKAAEAETKAKQMETVAGRQIAGRVFGGAPVTEVDTTPDASGLAEVAIQSPYRASPMDALRMASTPQGVAAVQGNPALAAALQQSMAQPEAEEFYAPTETEGGLVQFGKRGSVRKTGIKSPAEQMTPYQKESLRLQQERLKFDTSRPQDEPLIQIAGADGRPVLVPRSQAIGRALYAPSGASGATEGERKDAYNLGRIVNSVGQIQTALKAEPAAVRPGFAETAAGMLPFGIGEDVKYRAQSPQRQVIETAQIELIDAALTLATGAAYTKEQLEGQVRALIPRFGESDESVNAKNDRLRQIMQSAKVRAGRAWTPELDQKLNQLFPGVLPDEEPVIVLPPRR